MPTYPIIKTKWVYGNAAEAAYEGYRTYREFEDLTNRYPGLWTHRANNRRYNYRKWDEDWENSEEGRQYHRRYDRYWG